jgi:hypothetical protein
MSVGVFLGAPTPLQALASKPGKNSCKAGTSGNLSERVVLVIASGRNLRNLMNSIDPARLSKDAWTWPPRRSESVPRYGHVEQIDASHGFEQLAC